MKIKSKHIVGIIAFVAIISGIIALIIYKTGKSKGGDSKKCTNSDCNNHGTASGIVPDCLCTCDTGYSGPKCSNKDGEPCNRAACNNHGDPSGNIPNCLCTCDTGFSGPTCENDNHCTKANCSNHGTASGVIPKCRCECEDGFAGLDCSKIGWTRNQIDTITGLLSNTPSTSSKIPGFGKVIDKMIDVLQLLPYKSVGGRTGPEVIKLAKDVLYDPTNKNNGTNYFSKTALDYIISIIGWINPAYVAPEPKIILCMQQMIILLFGRTGPTDFFIETWRDDVLLNDIRTGLDKSYRECMAIHTHHKQL